MSFACTSRDTRSRGSKHLTSTGRELCVRSHEQLLGAAAGVMVGGGTPGAISTVGWFARIRETRRRAGRAAGAKPKA